jgi:Flp pilus assembly protein TadD
LASLRIAQKRYLEAQHVLRVLEASHGAHPTISHSLAHIEFAQQDYGACCDLLRAWVEAPVANGASVDSSLQVLWLRAMHRFGNLEEAWIWVQGQRAAGALSEPAAGVASLIAMDGNHLQEALALAEMALTKDPLQMEALVARASIALAQRDVVRARDLLARALDCNPCDGRTWSASGFAEMLGMNLERAKQHFEQALLWMPKHIGTWHGMAWTCMLQKDMAGAKRAFDAALALDRNFAESHGGLAVVLALTDDAKLAQEQIEIAMRLDKTNLSARYAQAILSGEVADVQAIERLAHRLLGQREAPLGGTIADWLPKKNH